MHKVFFGFVKQSVSITGKLADAALIQISHPADGEVAGVEARCPAPSPTSNGSDTRQSR